MKNYHSTLDLIALAAIAIVMAMFLTIVVPEAYSAQLEVNMDAIKMIESSGNPRAYNKGSKARGLYQITPILLKEWNNFHPKQQYTADSLWDIEVNVEIANWYLHNRIPKMLRYFKKPVTIENVLISYNAGINYVVTGNPLPTETKNYIKKYARLTK